MNIETIVTQYQPPVAVREQLSQVRVALLAGISGAGKDTIMRSALKTELFRPVVSHTTRAPRVNNGVEEQDGVEYHFIDQPTAQEMLENGKFIEAKYVHGTIYGTSAAEVIGTGDGLIALTDVDVQGVAEYVTLSSNIVAVFVVPPNYQTWIDRLSRRYHTQEAFDAEWPKRRDSAIHELSLALSVPYYHFLINDTLDDSVRAVVDIAQYPEKPREKDATARVAAQELLDAIKSLSGTH